MPSTTFTRRVAARFERETLFWRDVYRAGDVFAVIHQHRLALALDWIDQLRLTSGTPVLDVGCGAGLAAVALCQRGLQVVGVDPAFGMLAAAEQQAVDVRVADRLSLCAGDGQALMFADGTFCLVVALGVLPWLHTPERALLEMSRVLEPNGYLVLNVDNRSRLTYLLDPMATPPLVPVRKAVRRLVEPPRPDGERPSAVRARQHSVGQLDQLLASAGLEKLSGVTFGFGPFTLLGHKVLPGALGVALHHRLQRAATQGSHMLGATGAQYIVLARKVVT